eukprot:12876757-Alexandrium_andersonii.AAC.1
MPHAALRKHHKRMVCQPGSQQPPPSGHPRGGAKTTLPGTCGAGIAGGHARTRRRKTTSGTQA